MASLGRDLIISDEKRILDNEKNNNTMECVKDLGNELVLFTQKLNEVARNLKDLYTCAEKLMDHGKEIKKQLIGD